MSSFYTQGATLPGGTLIGFLDRLEQGDGFIVLAGWLATSDKKAATLPVRLVCGDDEELEIDRFFHRSDLAKKGIAEGACSFVVLIRTDKYFSEPPVVHVVAADGLRGQLQPGYEPLQPFVPRGSLKQYSPNKVECVLIDPAVWLGRKQPTLVVNDDIVMPLTLLPRDTSDHFEICSDFGLADGEYAPSVVMVTVEQIESEARKQGRFVPEIVDGRLTPGCHDLSMLSGDTRVCQAKFEIERKGKGHLESFRNQTVHGWGVGSDIASMAQIDILWDGIHYTTVKASEHREDLLKKGIVEVGGGFRYQFTNAAGAEPGGKISAVMRDSGIQLGCSIDNSLTLPPVGPADTGFIYVRTAAKDLPIGIVVPIYNAADDLKRCLLSLEQRVTTDARLILVDDRSPDPEIGCILDVWQTRPNVVVIRNTRNLGFSGTVNAGIIAAGQSDVVLLNSDTIVTSRWLEKLRQAAYSGPNVGTVTALSNNSGAFSVPEIGGNVYSDWLDPERVNRLIQSCTGVLYPEVPTGNGFCMYIRRDCIDMTGLLDAEAFPRGYGEENDFCMRAMRLGFRNIVDDRTFIYHKRSASFGEAKADLYDRGRQIVSQRYPEYARLTSVFSEDPTFLSMRWRVRKAMVEAETTISTPFPRILYVISTQTGGTPQTNRDLMGQLGDRYETWLLRCDAKMIELSVFRKGATTLVETHTLRCPIVMGVHRSKEYLIILERILTRYAFDIVHIRHIAWHSIDLPSLCKKLRVPSVFSFHDFYTVCPTVKLLDENNTFCGGRCTASEGECKAELWPTNQVPPLKHRFIHQWQSRMNDALRDCDAFVTTSPGAAVLLKDIFPAVAARGINVIPHGRSFDEMESLGRLPTLDDPLRILMPGNINPAKGSDLCEAVLSLPGRVASEFHVLGDGGPLRSRPGLQLHGRYKREEFGQRVRGLKVNIGAVLSIWPETYCHTLTEMWAAGLPVVAVDLGAVGERIREHGGGWLISPEASPEELGELLRSIRRDQAGYLEKRDAVLRWQANYGRFYTTQVMSDQYDLLYRSIEAKRRVLLPPDRAPEEAVVAVVSQFVPGEGAPASAHIRIGETTRSDADRPLLFRHYRSHAMLGQEVGRRPAAVIVQRDTLDPDDIDDFIASCRRQDVRIVLDCDDDLLSVPEDKDPGARYLAGRPSFTRLLRSADLISVSTPALAEAFSTHSKAIRLIPNMLSARLWLQPLVDVPKRTSPERPVALYMGTMTHDSDLQLLREPVMRIKERHPDFELRVIGGQKANEDWFTRIESPPEAKDYPRFVQWFRAQCQQADFALAPLEDNAFNRCKSDLKFLDYAAAGLAGIYSDTQSYRHVVEHRANGLLIRNDATSWTDAIETLITQTASRRRFAARAQAMVRSTRMSVHPGQALQDAISALLREKASTDAPSAAAWPTRTLSLRHLHDTSGTLVVLRQDVDPLPNLAADHPVLEPALDQSMEATL